MKELIFILTHKCNFNCPGCLRTRGEDHLDIDLAKKILTQAREIGYDTILITGGEPICYPYLSEFIDFVVKNDFKFTLVSNGFAYEGYIKYLDMYPDNFIDITLSMDSYLPELHDKVRDKSGSFARVVEAVNYFSKRKIGVGLSICLNKLNKDGIVEFVDLAERINANRINFLGMIPTPTNKDIVLNDNERDSCFKLVDKLGKERDNINILWFSSLNNEPRFDFCDGVENPVFAVLPSGDLKFCCDLIENQGNLGSLKESNLMDLTKKGEEITKYLINKRIEHYIKGEYFEGFNTCIFCNKYLKDNNK